MSRAKLSHRRLNLLTGESVLVSPHRTERPWQGQHEPAGDARLTTFDSGCYLCPGNPRAGGQRNPDYSGPWAFDNDFPALSAEQAEAPEPHPLLRWSPETGRCRVVCYTERHDLALSTLPPDDLVAALEFLFAEFAALDADPDIGYVQVFENHGEMMGCSNPHPHAQIWATRHIPNEPGKEWREQSRYHQQKNRPLLADYLAEELAAAERLVFVNEHAAALVPFWATWPFETLVLPRVHAPGPGDLDRGQLGGFADALRAVLQAYDALFDTPMPYSLGFHPRPSDGAAHPEWQFHAHLYPPLLRSATVRKHMVGFEMLGMPQRDLTPEAAAERLRDAWQKAQT